MKKSTSMIITAISYLTAITYPAVAEHKEDAPASSDIRDIVVAQSEKDIDIIVPDESIYGIAYGASEAEFIQRFGNPDGYIQLRNKKSGMLYGRNHIFIFTERRLSGLRIDSSVIDWKLANQLQVNPWFDSREWRLNNGIKDRMPLDEVRNILGDNLKEERTGYAYYYRAGKTTVTFNVSQHYGHLIGPPTAEQAYAELISGIFLEQD